MSDKSTQISGTNSPPAGEDRPMGQASVDGSVNAGYISDKEQRKEYFRGMDEKATPASNQSKKMGQSMADTMEQRMK